MIFDGYDDAWKGERNSPRLGLEVEDLSIARSHLVDELVAAFFVAMAVMWVVTTMAGIFA